MKISTQLHQSPALECRGVWEAKMEALFDERVVDTDAPSYANISKFSSDKFYKMLKRTEKKIS